MTIVVPVSTEDKTEIFESLHRSKSDNDDGDRIRFNGNRADSMTI